MESSAANSSEQEFLDGIVDDIPIKSTITNYDDAIQPSNRGFKLLSKMGWKGSGLGKSSQGIVEPIRLQEAVSTLGIGKQNEYDKISSEATKERRKLDIELEQTPLTLQIKQDNAGKLAQIENDIKKMNQEFYCDICDKQYKNVAEMANHLSSYDHHHKKRFREMKEDEKKRKSSNGLSSDLKRKNEERRIAKEMEMRIAKAQMAAAQSRTSCSIQTETIASGASFSPVIDCVGKIEHSLSSMLPTTNVLTTGAPVDMSSASTAQLPSSAAPVKFGFSMGFKKIKK